MGYAVRVLVHTNVHDHGPRRTICGQSFDMSMWAWGVWFARCLFQFIWEVRREWKLWAPLKIFLAMIVALSKNVLV